MPDKTYKATTIAIPEVANGLVLEEAFNLWSQETKPASILHVHYYHDLESHVKGYQVVYEEPWAPYLQPMTPGEEDVARLLV